MTLLLHSPYLPHSFSLSSRSHSFTTRRSQRCTDRASKGERAGGRNDCSTTCCCCWRGRCCCWCRLCCGKLEAVEAAAAVTCFSGALEKRVELAVRGAAIVLHSLGERGERYRGAGEKEGGRYTRKGEFDKRSGSGGAATDGKGGKLWRHRHGT